MQALFFAKVTEYRGQRQMTNPVVDVIVGASGDERDLSRVGRVGRDLSGLGQGGSDQLGDRRVHRGVLAPRGSFAGPRRRLAVRDEFELVDRTAVVLGHPPARRHRRRRPRAPATGLRRVLAAPAAARASPAPSRAESPRDRVIPSTTSDLDVGTGAALSPTSSLVRRFLGGHRFALTDAQRRVLARHRRRHGVARCRCTDSYRATSGSGKTVVALTTLLVAIDGGRQGALMAPTEVLAEQHLASLRTRPGGARASPTTRVLGGERPLSIRLLTGRVRARERQAMLDGLATAGVDIVVGTHALLTDDVRFKSLGAIVIDEQHRFGVEQRATLRDKGERTRRRRADPDLLVMTATPIPRTAAMVVFGDLDRSVLDEMPAGRHAIDHDAGPASDDEVDGCWQTGA